MADRSAIEWTSATWNPTTGCDRVSSGCGNCYALTLAGRLRIAASSLADRGKDEAVAERILRSGRRQLSRPAVNLDP